MRVGLHEPDHRSGGICGKRNPHLGRVGVRLDGLLGRSAVGTDELIQVPRHSLSVDVGTDGLSRLDFDARASRSRR